LNCKVLSISWVTTVSTIMACEAIQAITENGWKQKYNRFYFFPFPFSVFLPVRLTEHLYFYSCRCYNPSVFFSCQPEAIMKLLLAMSLAHRSLLRLLFLYCRTIITFEVLVVVFQFVSEVCSYCTELIISCLCICYICWRWWIQKQKRTRIVEIELLQATRNHAPKKSPHVKR
jgi:hypothetical protein